VNDPLITRKGIEHPGLQGPIPWGVYYISAKKRASGRKKSSANKLFRYSKHIFVFRRKTASGRTDFLLMYICRLAYLGYEDISTQERG
jgi:hypothetical protein